MQAVCLVLLRCALVEDAFDPRPLAAEHIKQMSRVLWMTNLGTPEQ